VGALALGAVLVASAAQAQPMAEFGQCHAAKKGFYSNSNCTERDESKGKPRGKFEWQAGPAPTCVAAKKGYYSNSECTTRDEKKGKPKGKFEKECAQNCADFTSTNGATVFRVPSLGSSVECASSSGTGEITGAATATGRITFKDCSLGGAVPCTSEGYTAGTITTAEVQTHSYFWLRIFGKEVVWWESGSRAISAPPITSFTCEGVGAFTVTGYVTGATGPEDEMTSSSETVYREGETLQGLETEVTTEEGTFGPYPVVEESTLTTNYEAPIEIRVVG
jgi:hypothetical protein